MHFEVIPRSYSVLVFEKDGDTDYTASCQVFVYGDKGFIHTLNGQGFYRCFKNKLQFDQFFDKLNICVLEAYMLDHQVSILKKALGNLAEIVVLEEGKMKNLKMSWVRIKRKDG